MVERIRGREAFRRFGEGATRVRRAPLTLVAARPGEHPAPAVAFAVPRRVGSAVVRNRIRRRLRAAARELDGAGRMPALWYLVVVHPRAAAASYVELRDVLAGALDALPAELSGLS